MVISSSHAHLDDGIARVPGPETRLGMGKVENAFKRRKIIAARYLLQLQQKVGDILDLIFGKSRTRRICTDTAGVVVLPHGLIPPMLSMAGIHRNVPRTHHDVNRNHAWLQT